MCSSDLFHAWLLFLLLAEAAIDADGGSPSRRFRNAALATALALVTFLPRLTPVGALPWGWSAPGDASLPSAWLRGALVGVIGAACGRMLARGNAGAFRTGMTLVGAGLGWQAAVVVFVLARLCGGLRQALVSLLPPHGPRDEPTTIRTADMSEIGRAHV